MTILNGIISKLNGSAGNLTFEQNGGQTIGKNKIGMLSYNRKATPKCSVAQRCSFSM